MNFEIDNNRVYLCGEIASEPVFSHEIYGEGFYETTLKVKRLSSQFDLIPITVSERLINEENLVIPHKYLHLRAFTLVPMLELNADYVHPVLHKTIVQMHQDLENPEMVFLYGTRVDFDF